ncbi:MAG: LmeA family phospholipid-binding protein [Fimbriimonadaceae bacterium]|nr:LmeA family phospholipid-binding protein [Fimbriimonadaceae bacterium]
MQSSFELSGLDAKVTGLRLANGLVVDSLEIEARDVAYVEVEGGMRGRANITARLLPASVERFLAAQVPASVQNVRVAFEGGEVVVRAIATLILTVEVTVRVALELHDEAKLVAVVISVEPAIARRLIEDEIAKVNPLLDSATLPIPTSIQSIEVRPEAVTLTASASAD